MVDLVFCIPFNFQCLLIFIMILNVARPSIHNEVDIGHLER